MQKYNMVYATAFILLAILLFPNICRAEDYIVALKPSEAKEVINEISDSQTSSGSIALFSNDTHAEVISEGMGFILVDEDKAKELLDEGKAEYIEENIELKLFDTTYNDPYFSLQSYYNTNNIQALKNMSNDGAGVRIGIVDSGVYRDHPDLAGANIETGYNYTNSSTDVTDSNNHGTSVTALIAAPANNSVGTAGIAPAATIIPLQVTSGESSSLAYVLKALDDAVDVYNCDVINLSLGTSEPAAEKVLKAACEYVMDHGVILVAAVGNDGNDTVYYPAGIDGVIGVGSVTSSLSLASYSQRNETVDVVAQGSGMYMANNSGGYSSRNGTSFAAPVVTGMVALMLGIDKNITPQMMNEYIKNAAVDLGDEGYDTSFGYGLLKGDELYAAYIGDSNIYIQGSYSKGNLKCKFSSGNKNSFYVYYAVYEGDVHLYGEYKKITLQNGTASDTFTYSLKSGQTIKVMAFSDFNSLYLFNSGEYS